MKFKTEPKLAKPLKFEYAEKVTDEILFKLPVFQLSNTM